MNKLTVQKLMLMKENIILKSISHSIQCFLSAIDGSEDTHPKVHYEQHNKHYQSSQHNKIISLNYCAE